MVAMANVPIDAFSAHLYSTHVSFKIDFLIDRLARSPSGQKANGSLARNVVAFLQEEKKFHSNPLCVLTPNVLCIDRQSSGT